MSVKRETSCNRCGARHGTRSRPKEYQLDGLCSFCHSGQRLPGERLCRACKNTYSRGHRKKHRELSLTARKKNICRSLTHVYVKWGFIVKRPCHVCGAEKVQAHHTDYSQPLLVCWLCTKHHREQHLFISC